MNKSEWIKSIIKLLHKANETQLERLYHFINSFLD